nr:hypothetical protein [Kocuria sp. 257]
MPSHCDRSDARNEEFYVLTDEVSAGPSHIAEASGEERKVLLHATVKTNE